MPKLIKDWNELSEEKSETHMLEIHPKDGNGWIIPKDPNKTKLKHSHYLSTHTFYGQTHEYSTKILQECGFNVVLLNWDARK